LVVAVKFDEWTATVPVFPYLLLGLPALILVRAETSASCPPLRMSAQAVAAFFREGIHMFSS
jgi:hypothetical protein